MKRLIFLAVIYSVNLCAQKTNIDLRTEFGPLRDQGSLGTCYASAMADCLTYWLKQKGFKRESPVSALAIELQHHADARSLDFEGLKLEKDIKDGKINIDNKEEEIQQKLSITEEKIKKLQNSIIESNTDLKSIKEKIIKEDPFWKDNNDNLLTYLISDSGKSKQEVENLNLLKKKLSDELDKNSELNKMKQELYQYKQTWVCARLLKFYPGYFSKQGSGGYEQSGGSWNKFTDISYYKLCSEKDVPSEQTGTPPEQQGLLNLNSDIKPEELIGNELNDIYSGCATTNTKDAVCKATASAKNIFPTVRENKLKRIIKRSYRKGEDAIIKIIDNICYIKLSNKPKVNDLDKDVAGGLFIKIDELLGRKIPVMIEYDPLVFRYGGAWLTKQDLQKSHMSILVGLIKGIDGSNEYIIRNSWGKNSCDGLYKIFYALTEEQETALMDEAINKVQYECKQPGVDYDTCKKQATEELNKKRHELASKSERPYKCNNGYFVIKKKALEQVLFGIVYLE